MTTPPSLRFGLFLSQASKTIGQVDNEGPAVR